EWDTRGKRSPSTQPGVTASDVHQKRDEWKQAMNQEIADRLVFLDESGINTDMTPIYCALPVFTDTKMLKNPE
ncbi:MAG: hypothetical protein LUC21_03090, partial [Oscillospiraceae bacterium]|nr:hypothetical protein [Oscillospiraceae bacterium]